MITQTQDPPELVNIIQVCKAVPVEVSKPHIVVNSQVPIDEEHPVVAELLGLGYELELCIQAAELNRADATAAQEYLMDVGEKEELSKGVLVGSSVLHGDTEMPLEKPAFEQQESRELTTCTQRCVTFV